MKRLYLIRHAKSSWDHPGLDDFSRPLNKRGKSDAPFMGHQLKKKKAAPDLIICSPAKRAFITSAIIAQEIGYPVESIIKEKLIYDASVPALLKVIHSLDDGHDTVMLIGHNPGSTRLAQHISDFRVDNIPTAGVVCIDFKIVSWKKMGKNKGKCVFFDYPKKHKR